MAELSTLARPYARAVFELGRDQNKLEEWSAQLTDLASFVQAPGVMGLITHPSITSVALAESIAKAMGNALSAEFSSFVQVLISNKRLVLAPQIADQFQAMKDEFESVIEVDITTASAVGSAQQQTLSDAIGKRLARQVKVTWGTDESLIAGAMIRAGDLVIDGSVQGELARLKSALTQ